MNPFPSRRAFAHAGEEGAFDPGECGDEQYGKQSRLVAYKQNRPGEGIAVARNHIAADRFLEETLE